jgi:hypothetical protein
MGRRQHFGIRAVAPVRLDERNKPQSVQKQILINTLGLSGELASLLLYFFGTEQENRVDSRNA